MEYVVIVIAIVILFIFLLAQDSKKDTKRERYGEAVGELARMTADKVSGIAHSITEPANKKKIRIAKEELANRNGCLYRYTEYSDKKYLERLLTLDDNFKSALVTIGLSEDKWKKLALIIFYIGTIRKMSRDSSDYTRKISKRLREDSAYGWSNHTILKYHSETLKNALNYFNVEIEEWIDYGDAVIEMYDLYDDPLIEEFGYINSILPLKNNKHLL